MNDNLPKVYVHYVAKHPTGMYGVMMDNSGLPFAVTLQPNDKYLPEGELICTRDHYHAGGYDTFEIQYEGHDRVLFHKGNHQEDSKLCVLVAESYELVGGLPGISQSAHAFEEFWNKYKDYPKIKLVVSYAKGIQ